MMNKSILQIRRILQHQIRSYSNSIQNAPIKFTTSPAAQRVIKPMVRKISESDSPWYQPYSVIISVSVFMIYFCALREENDVDKEFSKTLYDRIKGLEKEQLLQSYRYNKEHGLGVAEIEQRLKELEISEVTSEA